MNQIFQEKNRKRLSLPSGRIFCMAFAPNHAIENRMKSPRGLRTMANCQPSIR